MLTQEDDVEIHALAAAGLVGVGDRRHTGRDRKTVRKYLGAAPRRSASRRRVAWSRFATTWTRGWTDDAHMDATVLAPRARRARVRSVLSDVWAASCGGWSLRPVCLVVPAPAGTAVTVEIEHPSRARRSSGTGSSCPRRPGASRRSCWSARCRTRAVVRGVFCEQMTFGASRRGDAPGAAPAGRHAASLADRSDGHDRDPGHRPVDRRRPRRRPSTTASRSTVCPPRRAQRKGVVENAIKYVTRSWWRPRPVASDGPRRRLDLDRWSARRSPTARERHGSTVGAARPPRSRCGRCRRRPTPR